MSASTLCLLNHPAKLIPLFPPLNPPPPTTANTPATALPALPTTQKMNPQFEGPAYNSNTGSNNNSQDHDRIYSTETKEEHADIVPLEIEEGHKPVVAAAGPDRAPQQGTCARHKGKFICLGITLALLVATAIAVPLLLPKDPTATLLEQSNLRLDGLGTGSVVIDLRMKVDNPNRYAIAFQNLKLGTFWFDGVEGGREGRKGVGGEEGVGGASLQACFSPIFPSLSPSPGAFPCL